MKPPNVDTSAVSLTSDSLLSAWKFRILKSERQNGTRRGLNVNEFSQRDVSGNGGRRVYQVDRRRGESTFYYLYRRPLKAMLENDRES